MKASPKQLANLKRTAGPGRPKGRLNKVTVEIKQRARELLEDPEYLAALQRRLKRGTAGATEQILYAYGYGKPKETLDVNAQLPPFIIKIDGERE